MDGIRQAGGDFGQSIRMARAEDESGPALGEQFRGRRADTAARALLAGISSTWYTYLEQGRDIRVSDQVLDALARTLRLDRYEREHLFHLSGHEPVLPDGEVLAPEVAAVPSLLGPNPAYLIDGTYEVLSHNAAAAERFPHVVESRNFARWVFLDPVAREVLVDWEPEARGLLARLRGTAGRHPGDPRFTRLVEDLHACPEVREWWPRHEVESRGGGRKRLRVGGQVVEYAYTAFHVAGEPEQTLVIYADPRPG